ncbi:YeeE/YedE family protein [Acinetobacter sp. ANC 4635]|uniref:YeeE/YedE family protein n=1 Tax=Acinetobacter sp. ANC 4635 TaxID=2529846 RepID=UPI00104042A9|nr:YeeE/YedE family protein [Acinetobacter sp. ANC 4635]TCB31903.1 YeeE/YedE family protein [Acinetobacter sp. ANC 4635]
MHEYALAFFGGVLLGIATISYLYSVGKIAGVSGLIAQMLTPKSWFSTPAFWFLLGLIGMPFVYHQFLDLPVQVKASPWVLMLSGLLVGVGTRLGSGCTSGHGICGLSRLSTRSFVAVGCFMACAFLTVLVTRYLLGG